MKIRYSTNWMGPVSLDWYKQRGLTHKENIEVLGQIVEVDSITTHYSAGRIDVYGLDSYPEEIALPPMKSESWQLFSKWLETFETDDVWTLGQLVWLYEKKNPRIEWYDDPTS